MNYSECDYSSNIALQCTGIANKELLERSIANGTWSEWSDWSQCSDAEGNTIGCKGSKSGNWLNSKKSRRRYCLTGYNCLGDWVEKKKCTRLDFRGSRRIEPCPCGKPDLSEFHIQSSYSDFKQNFNITRLIMAYEKLEQQNELVANPVDCFPNATFYRNLEADNQDYCGMNYCTRKDYRYCSTTYIELTL